MATPGSQTALRATNRRRVLEHVLRTGSPSQAEIARQTGLSAATVSNIVRSLADDGLVELSATVSSGRRAKAVRISDRAGLAAGVDFGRSHVRVALASLSHEIIAEQEVAVPRGYLAAHGVEVAARIFHELLESAGARRSDVTGLGVGVPGPIDSRTEQVGSGSILPEWVGERLGALVETHFQMPAIIENDANLGALAEGTWGAGRSADDFVYIKVSTGIGAGIVVGGRLYRGGTGTAGEIGHTTVDMRGPVCRCGNRGCLEMETSLPVILERLAPSHGADLTIDGVVELLDAGDVPARRVVEAAGQALGVAVAGLCNLLNPSLVLIGGDLARAKHGLVEGVRNVVDRVAVPSAADHVRIEESTLGSRAQVLGALAVVLHSDGYIERLTNNLPSLVDDKGVKASE